MIPYRLMLFISIIQLFYNLHSMGSFIHGSIKCCFPIPLVLGTIGDSNNGISLGFLLPAGYGLVNLGIAIGVMPLNMPNTVLVVVLFHHYHCSGHSLIRKDN